MEIAERKVAELVRKITEAEQALTSRARPASGRRAPHSKLRKKPPAQKEQIQA